MNRYDCFRVKKENDTRNYLVKDVIHVIKRGDKGCGHVASLTSLNRLALPVTPIAFLLFHRFAEL